METNGFIKIGTCSWKYDSWRGLVYSQARDIDYLEEYSRRYSTVEIDQWFWSLFGGDKAVLPKTEVVKAYAASVPEGFTFTIKAPNSVTLTHHYRKKKDDPLVPNPHFLSTELMNRFLGAIEPLGGRIGAIMFQFEYLNKIKMAGLSQFLRIFEPFCRTLSSEYHYCVETRNPNYLKDAYFDYLAHHHLGHVFLQGYYMPPIFEIYEKCADRLKNPVIVRLHGPDREGMEEKTQNIWDRIVSSRDDELERLKGMLHDLRRRGRKVYVNVNNHYEGSAPLTIRKIEALL